jgi:S1 RNA binding domain protein
MQLEVGSILEGKVSGITNFGVFVDLSGGKTGMVHISEVAHTYVKDIKEFVTMHQTVKVKVLGISPEGKISLSMKQAEEPPEDQPQRPFRDRPSREGRPRSGPGTDSFEFRPRNQNQNLSFEDMMNRYKQCSDEKMDDLKDVIESRKGSQNRRAKNKNRGFYDD